MPQLGATGPGGHRGFPQTDLGLRPAWGGADQEKAPRGLGSNLVREDPLGNRLGAPGTIPLPSRVVAMAWGPPNSVLQHML